MLSLIRFAVDPANISESHCFKKRDRVIAKQ